MYPRLAQFGPLAIPTYGAFAALAIIAALVSLSPLARRLQLNPGKLWNLALIAILTALIGSRLLVVAEYFTAFLHHPFWVLAASSRIAAPWVGPAAVLLGLAAALLYLLAEGLPLLRVLDCFAPPVTLALAIGSIGAFLAGADFGLPAASSWSVTYSSRFAANWYGTPLGVPLIPVRLYQAIALLVILAILLWRLPRRRHDGELAGLWLFLAGLSAFFIDLYRASTPSDFIMHQAVCVAMVLASAAFLLRRKSISPIAPAYNVVDDPQHV